MISKLFKNYNLNREDVLHNNSSLNQDISLLKKLIYLYVYKTFLEHFLQDENVATLLHIGKKE